MFAGQPYLTPTYMMDRGSGYIQQSLTENIDIHWLLRQSEIVRKELNDDPIL